MTSIRATDVSYAYDGGLPIFENIDIHLEPGWTGLVGPNGAGKTTLLDLLRGYRTPTGGHVVRSPDEPVAWCPQRVDRLEPGIEAFANAWTSQSMRWMSRFELSPEDLARWSTLSPGERKRWQVAAALAAEPIYLFLDEPTNHLDPESRRLLVDALASFDGVGVVVSHDRALLDALTGRLVWLQAGGATTYAGDYRTARAAREAEVERARADLSALQATARNLRSQQARLAEAARSADRATNAGSRMSGPRDSDARSVGAKIRVADAAASLSRGAGALDGRLDTVEGRIRDVDLEALHGGAIDLDAKSARKRLVNFTSSSVSPTAAPERRLLDATALTVDAGERVVVTGPNGAGKTTLLRAVAECVAPSISFLEMPQEFDSEEIDRLLPRVAQKPPDEQGRIYAIVSRLGVDPERVRRSARPSPGEARKLAFAEAFASPSVSLLILDEPTNHLDLPSVERLEEALCAWSGGALIVTHDEWFADTVATRRLVIDGHTLDSR